MTHFSLSEAFLRRRGSLKWRTYGEDVLPMWVAEMDVMTPPGVRSALAAALESGDTGYPHGRAYADAFTAMAGARWGWELDAARQVRLGGDVMNGVLGVLQAITRPGDAVVINPPIYPPFRSVVEGYGRRLVENPMTATGRLDLVALGETFATERPAAYLLCSPHNPTGALHTAAELTEVMSLANQHGVRVVVDEIHALLIDPGRSFVPLLQVPGGEHALCVTSAAKAWNLAAFKAGLIIAGSKALEVLNELPSLTGHSTGYWGTLAHTAAIETGQAWVDEVCAELRDHKALLAELLADRLPGVRYEPAESTYLAWVDCSALGLDDPGAHFLREGRVAFNPGRTFGRDHRQWVRINVAASPQLITEAVDRMATSLGS